jgi:hypothetical protein
VVIIVGLGILIEQKGLITFFIRTLRWLGITKGEEMDVLDKHVGNSKHCTVDPSKLCKVTVNFKDGCCEFGLFCRIRIRGKEIPVRLGLQHCIE